MSIFISFSRTWTNPRVAEKRGAEVVRLPPHRGQIPVKTRRKGLRSSLNDIRGQGRRVWLRVYSTPPASFNRYRVCFGSFFTRRTKNDSIIGTTSRVKKLFLFSSMEFYSRLLLLFINLPIFIRHRGTRE